MEPEPPATFEEISGGQVYGHFFFDVWVSGSALRRLPEANGA